MSGHPEIIIVKRKGGHEDGHHGGAWKIAFADFMTAMMAFFLVLWIINATDKDTKTIIARYFNPVKLENPAKAKKGVHGVDTNAKTTAEENGDQLPGAPAPSAPTPAKEKAWDAKAPADATAPAANSSRDERSKSVPAANPAVRPPTPDGVEIKPTVTETALFSDPFQSLDRIAGGRAAMSPAPSPDTGGGEPTREAGAASIEAFRDPFKPIGPGAVGDAVTYEADAPPPPPPDRSADLEPQKDGGAASPAPAVAASAPLPTTSAESASVADRAAAANQLMKDIQQSLGGLVKASASPSVDVRATDEGLLVSLTDRATYAMFAVGSAEPRAALIQEMDAIAKLIKTRPGAIVVRGHTDARPYHTPTYDNWRLSSARAQMAYYMLIRAGVPEKRIERIEGYGDHAPRDPAHPLSAENRRIEILLRELKP